MPSISYIDIANVNNFVKDKNFSELESSQNEEILIKTQKNIDQNDPLNNLYLLVNNSSSTETNITPNKNEQFNGIILEKDTNRLVCANQNKVQDISNIIELKELINNNKDKQIRYEYCEDGTIIRLYNYQDHWYTATTKCIDARNSHWSSNKNFDELFWEVFDESLLQNLDRNSTYIFILLNVENRIVVKHTKNMLVYICKINNETAVEDFVNIFKGVYGIKRPNLLLEFNPDNINMYLHPFKRGILVKIYNGIEKKWDVYKYDFESYTFIKTLRGNVPEIKYRYLELLNNPIFTQQLEYYYPEHLVTFTIIKSCIRNLIGNIYKLYVESHIKHSVKIDDSHLFYITLRQLHAQYKQTNKPITYDDVTDKINNMDKSVLKKLLQWI